jgi:hypothetical protein
VAAVSASPRPRGEGGLSEGTASGNGGTASNQAGGRHRRRLDEGLTLDAPAGMPEASIGDLFSRLSEDGRAYVRAEVAL